MLILLHLMLIENNLSGMLPSSLGNLENLIQFFFFGEELLSGQHSFKSGEMPKFAFLGSFSQ